MPRHPKVPLRTVGEDLLLVERPFLQPAEHWRSGVIARMLFGNVNVTGIAELWNRDLLVIFIMLSVFFLYSSFVHAICKRLAAIIVAHYDRLSAVSCTYLLNYFYGCFRLICSNCWLEFAHCTFAESRVPAVKLYLYFILFSYCRCLVVLMCGFLTVFVSCISLTIR